MLSTELDSLRAAHEELEDVLCGEASQHLTEYEVKVLERVKLRVEKEARRVERELEKVLRDRC